MNNIDKAIEELDLRLFEQIPSQSTEDDKQSLLACQAATRDMGGMYSYLEIGSYLGGSIQPYLLDHLCSRIYSIDKRPAIQPDERGIDYAYQNNSTARMIENLRKVNEGAVDKIVTIDGDTRELSPSDVKERMQICFIDGEHTDVAVLSDFKFCLEVLDPKGGAIIFHDAQITYNGIADCIKHLEANSIKFHAYCLPSIVFVIEIGDFPLHKDERIMQRLVDNHRSYIFSLQNNDEFRRFANKFPFKFVRNFLTRVRGRHVSG